ncbi:Rrf2 family transcriptional regulator [Chryseobacterium sp.]|jgi:DNA-binding IscR family transcriptional regulator|uniref:Rrf2 family transcriptional regulator n=1 Tax=Chryseobacterium sp. TaxID=1871047 RepID=UPI002FC8C75E
MSNTRFATAIHIMTLLAKCQEEWLTSDWIAGSININPVIVRKELGILRDANLVVSKQGKVGGSQIASDPSKIKISDIYKAVKNSEVLGKKNQNPNPICPIGKDINENLKNLFVETDQIVINFLGNKNLKEFSDQF